ncbi:MAG: hypothetical protein ACI9JL_001163 [Paracoccaceae bacterium]|jgi:hypothetical protein
MRDLGVLKERIEYAERHLSASHSARERESQALMAMWRQIRDRFEAQEQEITRYRAQLAEMTNLNDELSSLVDRLIQSVEGGVADSENETVPEIARLADDLLQSQPASRPTSGQNAGPAASLTPPRAPMPPPASKPAVAREPAVRIPEPEEILELDTPADPPFATATDTAENAPDTSFGASLEAALAESIDDDDDLSIPQSTPVAEASASEGIRDLISRIENAVATPADELAASDPAQADRASADTAPDEEDEDLARELLEIEALRNELNGLRNKISAGN